MNRSAREQGWLDTLTDEDKARAERVMDMPIGMAIAFVDRDLRAELKNIKATKPLSQRLYDYGLAGAIVAYVLFDRGQFPPLFGGGK